MQAFRWPAESFAGADAGKLMEQVGRSHRKGLPVRCPPVWNGLPGLEDFGDLLEQPGKVKPPDQKSCGQARPRVSLVAGKVGHDQNGKMGVLPLYVQQQIPTVLSSQV
jgi:hypothetical protein